MERKYKISQDRILQILNNISEDELDCFTKSELIDCVRYLQHEWIELDNKRQQEESNKVLAALKAFESLQLKQYRYPKGVKPNCVREFLNANKDVPSFNLICDRHNRWFSYIDNLAPYHWETSKCTKCDGYKQSRINVKKLMKALKQIL